MRYRFNGTADHIRNAHEDKLRNTKSGYKGSKTRAMEERVNRDGLFAWKGTRMMKGKNLR